MKASWRLSRGPPEWPRRFNSHTLSGVIMFTSDILSGAVAHGIGGTSPGRFSQKRDALTYRQHFAACWALFIRENFESSEHAAVVFGVDASTARKWWEGSHAPSGFAVGYAYAKAPEAAARHLGGGQ